MESGEFKEEDERWKNLDFFGVHFLLFWSFLYFNQNYSSKISVPRSPSFIRYVHCPSIQRSAVNR